MWACVRVARRAGTSGAGAGLGACGDAGMRVARAWAWAGWCACVVRVDVGVVDDGGCVVVWLGRGGGGGVTRVRVLGVHVQLWRTRL